MEQRYVEVLMTAGTPQHEALVRHLGDRQPDRQDGGPAAALSIADVLHTVVKLGLDRLETEAAEVSYAAEASAGAERGRAAAAALRRRLAVSAARTDG